MMHSLSARCQQKAPIIFRRSLVIHFQTYMHRFCSTTLVGHAITIALEVNAHAPTTVRMLIFDYRAHEYVYSVHDRLHQWMANGVGLEQPTIREVVCLKNNGGMHVDDRFMKCMSVAYRVCIHLAFDMDPSAIHESNDEFQGASEYLQGQVFRMLDFLDHHPKILNKTHTLTVCQSLAKPIYEFSTHNHLLLVKHDFLGNTPINYDTDDPHHKAEEEEEVHFFDCVAHSNDAVLCLFYNPHSGVAFHTQMYPQTV